MCPQRTGDDRMRLGHARARGDLRKICNAFGAGHGRFWAFHQLRPERRGKLGVVSRHPIVSQEQRFATRSQKLCSTAPGDSKPVHQRGHKDSPMIRISLVKSAMKSATPAATHIAASNQKRMMTVVSGQPDNSKW